MNYTKFLHQVLEHVGGKPLQLEHQLELASGVSPKAKVILDLIIAPKLQFATWRHTAQSLEQYPAPRDVLLFCCDGGSHCIAA